jgi:hypothetical protein
VDLSGTPASRPRRRPAVRSLTVLASAVAMTAALGACGDDDDGSPSPETGGETDPVVLEVTIADGEVTPSGEQLEAAVGQQIELRVTSDAPDELHVHSSPEHEYEVEPGAEQVFTFSVDQPGQIEIETHETETVVAELEVS